MWLFVDTTAMWQDESDDSSSRGTEEDARQAAVEPTAGDSQQETRDASSDAEHDSDYERPQQGSSVHLPCSLLCSAQMQKRVACCA